MERTISSLKSAWLLISIDVMKYGHTLNSDLWLEQRKVFPAMCVDF